MILREAKRKILVKEGHGLFEGTFRTAYRAGFKGIGDIGEAHFELRLSRASALA